MESVTIIFSMFRLVFVEILSYGVRYTLQIYQNNFDFFEPDRKASLPSVPCNIFETLSIL